jgi:RNA polymerase-binding transcription factor DksA
MAVKKATSAARRGVPAKKAAPTKAVAGSAATKAKATRVTAPKTATKAGAAKATSTRARTAKAAPVKSATTPGATKVVATKAAAARTKTGATKVAATKAAAAKTRSGSTGTARRTEGSRGRGVGSASARAQPQRLRVRENEKPWTARELATVRSELEADIARLRHEISVAELDLAGLMRDIGDGAGDDPADAGTATFEREQEISLANNAREVFEQSARALARLLDGSYGICESCGGPIGKNRLLAFPRATLCMTCKSKQERR